MVFEKDMLALLEALPEACMLFKDGTLEYANQAAQPLVGEKRRMAEILGQAFPERAEQTLEDFKLGGHVGQLRLSPLLSGGGWVTLAAFRPRDYREDAGAKALLESTGKELRDNMAIASVAIDLLLPQIENLEDPKLTGYLAMLCQSQRKVQRMAGNLGCFCALVDEQLDIELEKYDLVELCGTLVDAVAGLRTNRKRTIRMICKESSLYTLCDGERIKRMLLNLISNSMRFTAADGSILLHLNYDPAREQIRIAVVDDGVGMRQETLSRVFHSFEVRPDLHAENRGLGMGLPIAYGIARLHGGTLVVESRAGEGTRVTVTLRKRSEEELKMHETVAPYGPTAQRVLLTELADVLDKEEYLPQYLD